MIASDLFARALDSFASPLVPTAVALGVALILLLLEGRLERQGESIAPYAVLPPLAAVVAAPAGATAAAVPLVVALVVAMLARNRRDLLHSECGVKLLWVLGPALALSWAGTEMLTMATGTSVVAEQWAVLQLGLEPRFLWSTALPLSLLAGVVLLGAAPFHFWMADLFHGSRTWLAPLAAAAFQGLGAVWLTRRLTGIEAFPAGADITGPMLAAGAAVAFLAGAATLLGQRRPERRVGTLASLHGGIVLAAPGATLFRRHPLTALVGSLPLLSLAGVPGTPGSGIWLDAARTLAATGHTRLLTTLAFAWLVAFSTAVQQLREGFGIAAQGQPPERETPWPARAALWVSGLGIAAVAAAWIRRGGS